MHTHTGQTGCNRCSRTAACCDECDENGDRHLLASDRHLHTGVCACACCMCSQCAFAGAATQNDILDAIVSVRVHSCVAMFLLSQVAVIKDDVLDAHIHVHSCMIAICVHFCRRL